MDSLIIFERETKISLDKQKKLGNWFTKIPIKKKILIFKEQRNNFYKLKNNAQNAQVVDDNLISVIAFYLAIDKFYQNEKNRKLKNKTMKMERTITETYTEPRRKVKRDQLLDRWSQIQEWRAEGKSSRKTARAYTSKYRLSISHQYILDVWNEVENDRF